MDSAHSHSRTTTKASDGSGAINNESNNHNNKNDENTTTARMSPSRRRIRNNNNSHMDSSGATHNNEETTLLTGRGGGNDKDGITATPNPSSSNYSTFHHPQSRNTKQQQQRLDNDKPPRTILWGELYRWVSVGLESLCLLTPAPFQPNNNKKQKKATTTKSQKSLPLSEPNRVLRRCILAVVLAVALCVYRARARLFSRGRFGEAEWSWDHNVYSPRQQQQSQQHSLWMNTEARNNNNNLLVAQVTGSNAVLQTMGNICSRPNRAYARQWGRDYVRFSMPAQNLVRSCFDKVALLSQILERQQDILSSQKDEMNKNHSYGGDFWLPPPLPPPPPRVVYDVVALFPPDAIITDLDQDLMTLLPEDKLLAIAGWDMNTSIIKGSNFADVLLINLKHKYASTVIQLWSSMVEPPVTCGAGNDLSFLLHAVEAVLADDEDMASVVTSLTENRKGMIASNAIKVIPMKVPGHKAAMLVASHSETQAILHTTADSVCYRYYPKCEVF